MGCLLNLGKDSPQQVVIGVKLGEQIVLVVRIAGVVGLRYELVAHPRSCIGIVYIAVHSADKRLALSVE